MEAGAWPSCRINPRTAGREVAVAGIGEEDDDGLALIFRTLGQLNCCVERRAGGNADQNALFSADEPAVCKRVLVRNGDDLVIDLRVEHIGDKARADALNLVRACPCDRTGDEAGSTATTFTDGTLRFRYCPTPVTVPPVPTPATK